MDKHFFSVSFDVYPRVNDLRTVAFSIISFFDDKISVNLLQQGVICIPSHFFISSGVISFYFILFTFTPLLHSYFFSVSNTFFISLCHIFNFTVMFLTFVMYYTFFFWFFIIYLPSI